MRHRLFDCERQLEISEVRADFSMQLQAQVARLNKELLLMGELQQKYQQRLGSISSSSTAREADQMRIDTLKHDLDGESRSTPIT